MPGKNKLQAGEAFVKRFPDHPLVKLCQNPQYRRRVFSLGEKFRLVEEMRSKMGERFPHMLQCEMEEAVQQARREMERACEKEKIKFDDFCAKWKSEYDRPFPRTWQDWQQTAAFCDVPAERILSDDWRPVDCLPFIQGVLERLKRERTAAVRGSDDAAARAKWGEALVTLKDHPEWSETKSPADWCKKLGVSLSTLKRWVGCGKLVVRKNSTKSWSIRLDTLRRFQGGK